ncbi:AMP-binding protein [Amycolatopsis acidicola]|uniref:AMP-binding protein n=1 Tax=Amycolatopsis acidicola TaxID=2596893 RepID=A0A5N0US94_9PSEU|nr:AMP-binding protein [Amycolatopsis acidicola]KAA9152162.1 AMP-binding protein [Amycolatopsis acidicola]
MTGKRIGKPEAVRLAANLQDYRRARAEFSWEAETLALSGLPRGRGLNLAHEAADRYADGPRRNHAALRWTDGQGQPAELTYGELARDSSRFANFAKALGVPGGERVFTLLGPGPDLSVTALGTLKSGCVLAPLFPAATPDAMLQRMRAGEAGVLVTTPQLYRRSVEAIRDEIPSLREILLTGEDALPGTRALAPALAASPPAFEIPPTAPDDPALLLFTSGTTGAPKGVLHAHRGVLAQYVSARYTLDLHRDDVFWCTADPGWAPGVIYGLFAPLCHGITTVCRQPPADASRWGPVLAGLGVTVWFTDPRRLSALRDAGATPEVPSLRFVASTGEPLSPELVLWSQDSLGLPVHNAWGQTETGAALISDFAAEEIRPGALGRPLPGIEACLLDPLGDFPVEEPDREGELALRQGWPSMFSGYWRDPDSYDRSFSDGWYRTGDLARRDEDGYYWFTGRVSDALVTEAGLTGPVELEHALSSHPAVAEAAVITVARSGGDRAKAFVALRPGRLATAELAAELLAFARHLPGSAAPAELEFSPRLPRTLSGKLLRRLLRAAEPGLPAGDVSTVEGMS